MKRDLKHVHQIDEACCNILPKGRQPIQDQSSVLGADILNKPRNNYYGRSSNYPQRIQLSPNHPSGEFRCSWEVKLCNSVILVVHVCKQVANETTRQSLKDLTNKYTC